MGWGFQLNSVFFPSYSHLHFSVQHLFYSPDSWNASFIKSDTGTNIFFSYIALVIDLIKNINRLGRLKSLEPFINAFIFFLIMLINIFTFMFENHYLCDTLRFIFFK